MGSKVKGKATEPSWSHSTVRFHVFISFSWYSVLKGQPIANFFPKVLKETNCRIPCYHAAVGYTHSLGDKDTAAPTEMYLPDLDNTPLSQALKNGLDWGTEDEVMVECSKLKQYFGVDTFLIQRISGRVHLHTKDEDESFPINCSKTKFSISLLQKVLEGADKQRATHQINYGFLWPPLYLLLTLFF